MKKLLLIYAILISFGIDCADIETKTKMAALSEIAIDVNEHTGFQVFGPTLDANIKNVQIWYLKRNLKFSKPKTLSTEQIKLPFYIPYDEKYSFALVQFEINGKKYATDPFIIAPGYLFNIYVTPLKEEIFFECPTTGEKIFGSGNTWIKRIRSDRA